jgi:hypothetical protein
MLGSDILRIAPDTFDESPVRRATSGALLAIPGEWVAFIDIAIAVVKQRWLPLFLG